MKFAIGRGAPAPVGILGGMGPAAGAEFVRLFVVACTELLQAAGREVTDQSYPEHWLAQVQVPDRSAALRQSGVLAERPLESMRQVAARLGALGARTLAIACNTAHAWHAHLQASFPDLEVIHGVEEVARDLRHRGVNSVGLLATQGTYDTGLYARALDAVGVACHVPDEAGRARVMEGIYRGVKAVDFAFARRAFEEAAADLARDRGCRTLIMGCTEIPLAVEARTDASGLAWVDPARVMARALAMRSYAAEGTPPCWR